MNGAKKRRMLREKKIAMTGWYSCMKAMGSVPKDEDQYFKLRAEFMNKLRLTQKGLDNLRLKV